MFSTIAATTTTTAAAATTVSARRFYRHHGHVPATEPSGESVHAICAATAAVPVPVTPERPVCAIGSTSAISTITAFWAATVPAATPPGIVLSKPVLHPNPCGCLRTATNADGTTTSAATAFCPSCFPTAAAAAVTPQLPATATATTAGASSTSIHITAIMSGWDSNGKLV